MHQEIHWIYGSQNVGKTRGLLTFDEWMILSGKVLLISFSNIQQTNIFTIIYDLANRTR